MANEEKILALLGELKADMDAMKADIEAIKRSGKTESRWSQKEVFHQMSELLSDEEREDFGRFMDAEEERKAALYG